MDSDFFYESINRACFKFRTCLHPLFKNVLEFLQLECRYFGMQRGCARVAFFIFLIRLNTDQR